MNINELFTNDSGRLSTTNTMQMMSAITLCISLFVSLFLDRSVTGELAIAVAGMETLTATSKGFVSIKKISRYSFY
ncbi:DUF2644 domain-containing protein [Wohlfahrtiimonas populi]|uniref:DUF2644 domain-containing protein n=1 Tax=Wohlfahrtiimonas populi TaxID=1940240 RepID=UPI00098D4B1E